MTITNHLLAGSLIALTIKQPELAIGIAYCSHFAMDAIPHFGYPDNKTFIASVKEAITDKKAEIYIALSAITFIAALLFLLDKHRYFAVVVGLIAVLPDMVLVINYLFYERKGREMKGLIATINLKFHRRMQYERPWGMITEAVAFVILSVLLLRAIKP